MAGIVIFSAVVRLQEKKYLMYNGHQNHPACLTILLGTVLTYMVRVMFENSVGSFV